VLSGTRRQQARTPAEGVFWEAFFAEAASVKATLREKPGLACDRVAALLADHGFEYAFDLSLEEGNDAVLVLSPEGDPAAAREIDALLESRPHLEGWKFHGRRQAKDLEDALAIVRRTYGVDARGLRVAATAEDERLAVEMWGPALRLLRADDRESLVATLLDHLLGEERVMRERIAASGRVGAPGVRGLDLRSFVRLMVRKTAP
jgi:hypothetical protein